MKNKEFYIIVATQVILTLAVLAFLQWGGFKAQTQASSDTAAINSLSARLGQVQVDLNQIKAKLGVMQVAPQPKTSP